MCQAAGWQVHVFIGLLCEMVGYGVPVVIVPHCKPELASRTAFTAILTALRGMGVQVLFDSDAAYERVLPSWNQVVEALPLTAAAGSPVAGRGRPVCGSCGLRAD
jgi:hypothetical protein